MSRPIEMHINISQETSEEPLHTEIYKKNAAAQIEPRTQTHTLCEPAQSNCTSTTFHKSHCMRKFTGEMPWPRLSPRTHTHTHTLCEPAQSTCMSTCHKIHFILKFTGKMPAPRLSPERRHALCASLRSRNAAGNRNACQDFTRATLYGPKPRRRLCASLRSRNACQDFTRATLYEPAQSKRVSRFHRSHFMQKFTGKMPQTRVSTLIKHRPLLLTQEPLSVDTLCGEKAFSRVWGFE